MPQPPKRASGASGPSKRGGGGHPRDFLRPGFLEKAWIPRPGPGGEPTSQVLTCDGPNRTTCQGRHGALRTLWVSASEATLGRSAPLPLPARRGVPISPEKWGEEEPGPRPWTPGFMARSLSLARFGDRCLWYDSGGCYFRYAKTDLERIFPKKYAEKHFCERKSPNQGTYMGLVIAYRPEQCGTTAKTSECQRAAPKLGGAGAPPRLFASGLSLEKAWIPPPGPGGNPRRRFQPAMVSTGPPADGKPGPPAPPAGAQRRRSKPDHLPTPSQKNLPSP